MEIFYKEGVIRSIKVQTADSSPIYTCKPNRPVFDSETIAVKSQLLQRGELVALLKLEDARRFCADGVLQVTKSDVNIQYTKVRCTHDDLFQT